MPGFTLFSNQVPFHVFLKDVFILFYIMHVFFDLEIVPKRKLEVEYVS